MIRLHLGDSDAIAAWVKSKIPHVSDFGVCQAIGIVNNGLLLAGVVYHDYQPAYGSIQLSMAAANPRWAKREIIAGLLNYPFEQLDCYRVFTLTPIHNTMALRVNEHIGFKREAVCHSGFGKGKHAVVMRMLKPDYVKLYEGYKNG